MTGSPLATYLAALADETPEFRDGARMLDHGNALSALLDEIDVTVLPAVLTFENGSGALSLLVTGRRLHRIVSGGGTDVDGKALSPDDTDLTKAAALALDTFAKDAKELGVRSSAPDPDATDMSDRVSVRALQSALGIVIDDPDAPPLDRFMAQMGDRVLAAIHLENRVATKTTGPAIDVTGLKIVLSTQLSSFLDARVKRCASHTEPSLTLLMDVVAEDTALGLVTFDTQTALFTCAAADVVGAQKAFHKIV